jgi:cell division protein FtsL
MKITRLIIVFVFVTILGLAIGQVVAANSLSTSGIELAKLQTEIKKYKKQNAILKEKVLYAGSLTKIASEAGQMGFVNTTKTIDISSPLPIAKR